VEEQVGCEVRERNLTEDEHLFHIPPRSSLGATITAFVATVGIVVVIVFLFSVFGK
jgi:hypothetical protein